MIIRELARGRRWRGGCAGQLFSSSGAASRTRLPRM